MIPLASTNIILIGPGGAGKSTIGKLLGEKLNLPWLELDDLRWAYHDEIGYDKEYASRLRREEGFTALVAYWEKFTIHSLERVLEDYPNGHVISTGAGAVVFDNAEYRARAEKILEDYPFIVLLLPSSDVETSVRMCTERIVSEYPDMASAPDNPLVVNDSFIRRRVFDGIATSTIYNGEQTPEETCEVIIQALQEKADS